MKRKPIDWLVTTIMLVSLFLSPVFGIVEDAQAQMVQETVYRVRRGARWNPVVLTTKFPCAIGDSLYRDGWLIDEYGIEVDSDANYDYQILSSTSGIDEWHIHTYDETYAFMVHWQDFGIGADGHPHLAGAWIVQCSFLHN